jgi:microcystin-dependent protein
MSEPFVAEISIFAFNFAPKGWAFCRGQLMPIAQNTALFSLLGTMYGGDGKSTFALPDLQDSTANSFGKGPGLETYDQGQIGGTPTVTLLSTEIPAHAHFFNASTNTGTTISASTNQPGLAQGGTKQNTFNANIYNTNPNQASTMLSPQAIGVAGGNLPHNNMQPYLTLNFCIALAGVFPARG